MDSPLPMDPACRRKAEPYVTLMYGTQHRFQNKVAVVIKLAADYIHKKGSKLIIVDAGRDAGILLRHLGLDLADKYAGADITHGAPGEIAPKRCQDEHVFSPLSG